MLAGSHTLGGHFLFKPLTIENMNWIYTNILHNPRKALGISVLEYCVLDYVYKTQTHPEYGVNGWTKTGCHKIADFLGVSSGTVKGIFDRMDDAGLLERMGDDLKRATAKFYSIAYEQDVQKLNDGCSETERVGVQKLNGKCLETERYIKKEIKEEIKVKESTPIQIHDQVDKTKVVVHDEIKPNKQLQFVSEVVAYLNQKTNQQFKETTKETIQFINSRVKLDGWELEDFKAVIDFKTNEWLKDDKMRQYLCPSTLFRASNAEKYLLAAKASKPKPPVKPTQPTKVHVEERPVLTQHDIEYSQAAFASVEQMFKQMGV